MILLICISFIKLALSYLDKARFHAAIQLENGNLVIFTGNGLYTLDKTFQFLYNRTTSIAGQLNYYDRVKQFSKEDGDYILYVTKTNHYILNSYGNLVSSKQISTNIYNHLYSIIPYNHLKDELNYYVIYFNNKTQIIFRKYSQNFDDINFGNEDFYSKNIYGNENNLITCQLMKYSNEKIISCFFLTHLSNEFFINCTVFKSEENFEVIQTSQIKIEGSTFYRIESEVIPNNERQKALIILPIIYKKRNCLFYAGYDINFNNFTYGYLIDNNCNLYYEFNYYVGISYFKETEEFIVSALSQCTFYNTSQYGYLIYSFNNNFEYSLFGILGDLVLGDTSCKNEAFTIYEKSLNTILFSSHTQKYCIILNLNTSNIISMFLINKEINIINPIEMKSSDSPPKYICENYLIFNDTNFTNNLSLKDDFKRLSENNFIEKCTSEINYITSNFTCDNYIYKAFEFSFNCSKKYPYELVDTHKCVEYCDENDLSNEICLLNYHNSNDHNITENINNTDSYEVINKQTDIISTEFEFKDIKTYSKDTILETRNKESDSIINSDINLITSSKDVILETGNIESDITISSDSNIIINSTDLLSDFQTINNLIITNKNEYTTISQAEQRIYDLLDEFLKKKNDSMDINFIQNIFSGLSINNILDNILNGDEDIIISNNETIIQITSTDNQKNNKNHNISTINFGECEENLKSIYNINPNKSLLILKVDSFIIGSNIPVIQYEVYHSDNKSKLDLNLCNNKIEINIPVSIDENNLYKYEQDSDYYNDRCYSYASDNGNDKPLEYRRKEFIINNMSLCEAGCDYIGYNYETKNSKCKCELKKEISIFNIKIDTERLYNQFTGLTSSNIGIIKCYYLLFQKENLIYNIGFYVILFIIIIFCIGAIIFIFRGYNLLVQKIEIIIKFHHLLNHGSIKRKNNMKKKRQIKNNKSIEKNNPPVKRVKIRSTKEVNNRLDLTNEGKSFHKLSSKNNENMIKDINGEKAKLNKDIKIRNDIIIENKKKLISDIPYSKVNALNMNDYELNNLQYKEAIEYDKRTYFHYYWSLLKKGNLFLFSFILKNDYNSTIIKICLFFFSFGLYYTVNALFFTDSTMNKIYEDNGEYDFVYQIPKILYSNLICTVINLIVRILSLSEKDILNIKKIIIKELLIEKVKKIKQCLIIKFIFYYITSFLLLFIFLFYTSCFCAVYKNTQLHLIKDTLISFSLSLLYPFVYYLIPGIFRLPALRKKNKEFLYKISLILQLF